jgi:hypothetical protein
MSFISVAAIVKAEKKTKVDTVPCHLRLQTAFEM